MLVGIADLNCQNLPNCEIVCILNCEIVCILARCDIHAISTCGWAPINLYIDTKEFIRFFGRTLFIGGPG